METLLIIDWLLFIFLGCCVVYLFVYAAASKGYKNKHYRDVEAKGNYLIVFPAYKEDRVIVDSVRSFLEQNYPSDYFDVMVISDHMSEETNEALAQLPIRLIKASYAESSKAKALALAVDMTKDKSYKAIIILDADNTVEHNFLTCINKVYEEGHRAIQCRRTGKNSDTDIAKLDSVSEEINNGIFRRGHNALKLPAALSGSGMIFEMDWFRKAVGKLRTAGEDKELECLLLEERIYIEYVNAIPVYDEKTRQVDAIGNQRKRWMASTFMALGRTLPGFIPALLKGNLGYVDKVFQWMLPPRLVQIGAVMLITIVASVLSPLGAACKWYVLLAMQIAAMILPIPSEYMTSDLIKSVFLKIPRLIITTFVNLFHLKGASKRFIHTEHGE